MVLTLAAVAAHKKIKLETIQVHVRCGSTALDNRTNAFSVDIDIDGHLTERERKILFNSSRSCEIGKMLRGQTEISYQLSSGVEALN
ncbi:MAG: hypothetical protein EHM85_08820 [Desulfobacteraceae bacterium]|nr:MAG: hypothetical protein EHM85_08820 [Desulfobacteraceae bacterium]